MEERTVFPEMKGMLCATADYAIMLKLLVLGTHYTYIYMNLLIKCAGSYKYKGSNRDAFSNERPIYHQTMTRL